MPRLPGPTSGRRAPAGAMRSSSWSRPPASSWSVRKPRGSSCYKILARCTIYPGSRRSDVLVCAWGRSSDSDSTKPIVGSGGTQWGSAPDSSPMRGGKFYTAPSQLQGVDAPSTSPPVPWLIAGMSVLAGGYLILRVMRNWATGKWSSSLQASPEKDRSLDDLVAGVTTSLVGIDPGQMDQAVTEMKKKEGRLVKAQLLVEEMRTKADAMQSRLRAQLEEREKQLAVALETAEVLEAEVESVWQVVKAQEDEMIAVRKAAAEHAVAAQSALEESHRRVQLLEAMVGTLRQQLTVEETKSSGLSDKLRQSEEELKAANSRVAEMEAKLLQLETELEETGERWRLAMLKAEELEARVAVMQKENEALAGTIDQMQTMAPLPKAESDLQAEAASLAADRAEEKLAEVMSGAEVSQARVKELEEALEAASRDLTSAEEKAAQEMANKVAEMARMESLYKDKQDDTEKKLVLREQEVIRRDLELQGALRSLSKKEVEVSGLRVQAKDSELELQAVRKEAQETEAGLQQAREEAANLEAELREVRAQQQQAEAEGSAAIEQLRSQVRGIQAKLEAAQNAAEARWEEARAQEAAMTSREEELAKAKHLVAQRETELEAVRSLVQQREQNAKDNAARARETETAVMRLKALVSEREGVLQQLQAKVKSSESAVETAQQELERERKAARDEARRRALEVAAIREELQTAVSSAQQEIQQQRSQLQQVSKSYEEKLKEASAELEALREAEGREKNREEALAAAIAKAEGEVRMLEGKLKQVEEEARSMLKGDPKKQEAELREQLKMVRAETNSAENGGDDQWLAALKEQAISFEGTQLLLLRSAMTGSLAQQESRVRQQLADARAILLDLRREAAESPAAKEAYLQEALTKIEAREAALAEREAALGKVKEEAAEVERTKEQLETTKAKALAQAKGMQETVNEQIAELRAFQEEMRRQSQDLSQMKKRYQNEVAQAQRLASEASAEAERLRAEVKQRDTELVSLRLGIPSAAMLMMQTLEDQAVVEALAKAGGDLAGALGKAAKEVGEGGDISSAVAKAGGDVAGALRKAADGVRGTDGRDDGAGGIGASPSRNGTGNGTGGQAQAAREGRRNAHTPSTDMAGSMDELAASLWGASGSSSTAVAPAKQRASGQVAVGQKMIAMMCSGHTIPHPDKVEKGGEDAFFVSPAEEGGGWLGALGVADGVGAWSESSVDPGEYSKTLMQLAADVAGPPVELSPQEVLEYAQTNTDLPGSSTACVMLMRPGGRLSVANVGDCGFRVIRGGKVVEKSKIQEHEFNMPYQLASPKQLPDTDTSGDADLYELYMIPGDILVVGTDGLFDNMWDEELCNAVEKFANGRRRPRSHEDALDLAIHLADMAATNGLDQSYKSPFAVEAANLGIGPLFSRLFPRGGKPDDTTVVVAFMEQLPDV